MPAKARLRNALPDFIYYRWRYWEKNKSLISFRNPRRFSEKITARMRYPHPDFTVMADKYKARDYIAKKVGEAHLPKLYLTTKALTQAEFDALPARFMMKSNHACGHVLRIEDKSQHNFKRLRKTGLRWLAQNFQDAHREKQYADIPRLLIFEEVVGEPDEHFLNYRLHSFRDEQGKFFLFCQVGAGSQSATLLADWTPAEFIGKGSVPFDPPLKKPQRWEDAVRMAEVLLGDHPYMRVDLYLMRDLIYVGELTMTPAAGFYRFDPPQYDLILGQKYGPEVPAHIPTL